MWNRRESQRRRGAARATSGLGSTQDPGVDPRGIPTTSITNTETVHRWIPAVRRAGRSGQRPDVTDEPFDLDRIEAVAARLDLRAPNREALESIAFEVGQHFETEQKTPPFRAVVDAA